MRQLKISQRVTIRDEKSLNLYFNDVNRYKMISAEDEIDLAIRIQNGDELALQMLVEANLRFVISVAKQYQNQGLSFADLINEGNVGLVKAAKKFDETRGFKFISYAVWWIRQSIVQAIQEQTRVVRLPLNRLSTMKQIIKATNRLEQQLERDPSNNEIADYLDIDEEKVSENNIFKNSHISFDKPLLLNSDSDLCLYDLVESRDIPSPDSELELESVRMNILYAINKLNSRESEIINLTFGLNNNSAHSLNEIAVLLDISSERVRQIKRVSLLKLKKIMSGNRSFLNS